MRSPLLLAFFPTDALGACLLASGRRALRFGRTAGGIRLALPTLLATARLTCLAVDPSFATVLTEPFAQIAHFFLLLFPQFFAPTVRHLESAPEAYALGQTL